MLRVYAVTVFLSAFLLFLVQPLIAKQILPWFGGSAAVWATCMVFFQSALLAVDAFAGDAIPTHLLTSEAFDVYLRHLKPDGVLLVHATNRYLDLPPVIARVAQEKGLQALLISDPGESDEDDRASRSDWVAMARSA
ncbi:MAG TPA: hypothetical protein VIH11_08655, partial [Gemmatimonadaceae bacterium]